MLLQFVPLQSALQLPEDCLPQCRQFFHDARILLANVRILFVSIFILFA
ncbi:MAG: hypothetical protein MR209_01940 [Veillonellaceae bacterium]|nr:hypothetical protein [Veillonellaceae bacterium]